MVELVKAATNFVAGDKAIVDRDGNVANVVLGDAAVRNVGTGAGTVAAGDDPRLADARTPTAHTHPASEISDASAAGQAVLTAADAAAQRTALGLGTAAVVNTSGLAVVVDAGGVSTAARPTGYAQVWWKNTGNVVPTNAATGDLWLDES